MRAILYDPSDNDYWAITSESDNYVRPQEDLESFILYYTADKGWEKDILWAAYDSSLDYATKEENEFVLPLEFIE